MPSLPRVLFVDPDSRHALTVQQHLTNAGFDASLEGTIVAAVASLERARVDAVLVCGFARSDLPALTAAADDATLVVDAGGDLDALLAAVDGAARETIMRRELALLRARVADTALETLVGRSSAMVLLREMIGRAAASRRTVLITGEAGVGKDVAARLVHDLSDRAARPFVSVRCSGDDAALEPELFGVAPSPDSAGREGLLETARGGTVVLDECTLLSPALRARVGRAIALRTAPRVGDEIPAPCDVRIILTSRGHDAAGRDLRESAIDGVGVLPIAVPALRERRSDIPLLVQHFRARLSREHGLEPRALTANRMMSLLAREWPGNVRELQHSVERDAYGTGDAIPASAVAASAEQPSLTGGGSLTLEQLERRYIGQVLEEEQGNQSRAAERLGIDRRTLYRKLKEYRDAERQAS